jgi:chromosome partitioning protein
MIAIANQKGGVGKTTTAVNLAACLAEQQELDVLIIDIDPQGNTTSGLGADKEGSAGSSIYEVLIEDLALHHAIQETDVPNLKIVPSTIDLAGAEIELVPMLSRETKLRKAMGPIRGRFDFIIVDCPPSLGLLTINALVASDSVIVPIQCEYYALEGLGQLMNTINLIQRNLNRQLQLEGVVLTMFDARTNLSIQVADEVKRYFNQNVFKTIIPRNVRLSEAPSYGKPIIHYDDRSRGAEVYSELAKEVIEHAQADHEAIG